jgi:hypothetical protein
MIDGRLMKASSSFSEEKEPKRLLLLKASGVSRPRPIGAEVFCAAFFQKSGYFLP